MTDNTNIDPDQLRQCADRISGIMTSDVMKSFDDLPDEAPTCGDFPTAKWLRDLVSDRMKGLRQQALLMRAEFNDIGDKLHVVAGQLEGADSDNGSQMKSTIDDLGKLIGSDSSSIASGGDGLTHDANTPGVTPDGTSDSGGGSGSGG